MDLRDHITALAATADRIGLGYSRDAARAVHHHVDELRDALDEHALKVTAAMREAHAAKDAEIERLTKERNDARALIRAHVEAEGQSCGCADADRTYAEMEAHHLAEIERLRGDVARAKDALGLVKARIPAGSPHRLRDRLREAEAECDRLRAELQDAERRIDRQVKRGDRLTEWVRDVRLLHTRGPRTDTCNECGVTWPCSTRAALDQPGDQEGTTP